ncbi:sugar ABC transporter ATP-binding protein [Celerinatantimonas sp. MCCC 1A17872]|uniref:sugar ABC transporter ATP-binding protein n=1 Tax=Celerinatantimonas sp. MCCC 1A17872 TaxID=3177514 RepID=UPI0038C6ED43
MSDPILRLAGIDKIFTGVHALSDVSMSIEPGEVHALLGENGAGKSTLIKVITGVYSLDGGNMWLEGQPFAPKSSSDAQAHGVSTVYQEVNLIPTMSVASNLFLERQPRRFGLINWKSVHNQSVDLLRRLKLDIDVERPLGSYSIAIQQLVAIARALALKAKILILDEPTASLDSREVKILFDLMRELKSQGMAIIFVTHFLDQVYEVSDRITVLRNGEHVATHLTKELAQIELVSLMLGKAFDKNAGMQKHTKVHADTPYLDVEGIAKKRVLDPINLKVHAGEVLGLAGLLGSGRSETVNLIFGAMRSDQGKIKINGHNCHIHSPRQAIRQGLGFCPEDRRHDGLVGELSVRENIILALQAKRGWLKPVSEAQQHKIADSLIKQLGIVTPDAEKPAGQLSGGNQQKVILARWLAANPNLLILDEPTRGIDIGAHAEIVALIRRLCEEQGMALLVVSSELDEVVSISDRILVLRERHQAAELEGEQVNQQQIIEAIAS